MTDEQLLERLGAALVPMVAPPAPPASSVQDLHRAIDASRSRGIVPARRPSRSLLPIALAAAVAAACVAVFVVATSLPRIDRETATQITVTATSPALGELTERRRALEAALADGDVAAVSTEVSRLRLAIGGLAPSEWAPIRSEIEDLLARADALLGRRRAGNDETPGISPAMTSTTQAGVAPVADQPATSGTVQRTSPAAQPTGATSPGAGPAPSVTAPDDDEDDTDDPDVDEDNSGPGGGEPADDNSGPGGGEPADDDSGSGSL